MRVTVPLVVVLFLCAAPSGTAQTPSQHEHAGAPPERLGTVHFDTSVPTAVTAEFDRAVACCTRSGFTPPSRRSRR